MKVKLVFGGILRFKKIDPAAKIMYPAYEGDTGYDICAIEDKVIKPHGSEIVRTGLIFEIPEDYYGQLQARSSQGVKNTMRIHPGIIDSGYRGEITVRIYNLGNGEYNIKKGDKIAQLIIHPRVVLPLKETNDLHPSNRDLRGLGSSGR